MTKAKKSIAGFTKLDVTQMSKVKGGYWVTITKPDGTTERVWV